MRKLMMILALGVLFAGCNDDDTTDNGLSEIAIAPATETFDIDYHGGATEITVSSNTDWRLAGKKTWCQPSSVAGKSGEKVTFTIAANDTEDVRVITYKFFCGNKTIPFTVRQTPLGVFKFESDTKYDIAPMGGDFTIRMGTNVEYSAVINDDAKEWISLPETRAVHTERMKFLVAENKTYLARTGHVTFIAEGKEYVVTVNQGQNNAIIPEQMIYAIDPAGAPLTIKLQSNVAYTISIPTKYQSWITPVASRALTPGQASFTIGAATGTRAGKINFANKELGLSVTVVVKQSSATPIYGAIPDLKLRQYLADNDWIIAIDETGKCEITEDGLNVKTMKCNSMSIASVAGMEVFPKLNSFSCAYNDISVVDISKWPAVTKLTIAPNPIKQVILGDSKLATLDLSNNYYGVAATAVSGKNLTSLNMYYNYNLETLDVSECPALNTLDLRYCNYLTTLYLKTGQTIASITGMNSSAKIEYK